MQANGAALFRAELEKCGVTPRFLHSFPAGGELPGVGKRLDFAPAIRVVR